MDRAIALLSGGIDSPVAIHRLKDKLDIVAVHFHQRPLTDEKEIEKVKALTKKLGIKKLYLIPITDVFKEIATVCKHRYYYIITKIAMLKAAEIIADKENAKYLITGENLAQVSSQTLSNMKSISLPIKRTILRPLLTFDKVETIKIAEHIGTYEISKGPEVCCLLGPKKPATRSDPKIIQDELQRIQLEPLLISAINNADILERRH